MESWNEIIQVAMIGTEKKAVNLSLCPDSIQKLANKVVQNSGLDREERYLQIAALANQARRAGFMPYNNDTVLPQMAPSETLPYAGSAAHSLLKQIMEEDELPLLKSWLQQCMMAEKIINPEWLPLVFEKGQQHRKLQALLAKCGGKRGEWLCRYQEAWNYSNAANPDEIWMHGNWEQRKDLFGELRQSDRKKAMDLLQQTWNTEDANTRLSLLELMEKEAGADDLEFLESLHADKSKKVKDKSLEIQKKIPESATASFYHQFMKEAFTVHKEKSLLGMLSKTTIRFRIPSSLETALFKTGIEKISAEKGMSDEEYICYQIISWMPPTHWKSITGIDEETFIQLLQKDEFGKKMVPALVLSIKRFRDVGWAQQMLLHSSVFYIDLIPFLDPTQQEQYSLKYFEKFPDNVLVYSLSSGREWSMELCDKIIRHTASRTYQFSRQFYSEHIALIPVGVAGYLERYSPQDSYQKSLWKNISEHLYLLLKLKHQTKQSFHS